MNTYSDQEIDKIINDLWAGTLLKFEHDMLDHVVKFFVEVNENEVITRYQVIFENVFLLEISYDDPANSWNYVELTEVEIKKTNKGYSFESEMWSDCFLKIESKNFTVIGTHGLDPQEV